MKKNVLVAPCLIILSTPSFRLPQPKSPSPLSPLLLLLLLQLLLLLFLLVILLLLLPVFRFVILVRAGRLCRSRPSDVACGPDESPSQMLC